MSKTLAIVGSNSAESINRSLTEAVLNNLGTENEILDLLTVEVPFYSAQLEAMGGIPKEVTSILEQIDAHDAIVFSTPEHNGYLPAIFKNLLDWFSRADGKFLKGKPVLLLSTSPGGRAGAGALKALEGLMGYFDGDIKSTYSLPSFHQNFNKETKKNRE